MTELYRLYTYNNLDDDTTTVAYCDVEGLGWAYSQMVARFRYEEGFSEEDFPSWENLEAGILGGTTAYDGIPSYEKAYPAKNVYLLRYNAPDDQKDIYFYGKPSIEQLLIWLFSVIPEKFNDAKTVSDIARFLSEDGEAYLKGYLHSFEILLINPAIGQG